MDTAARAAIVAFNLTVEITVEKAVVAPVMKTRRWRWGDGFLYRKAGLPGLESTVRRKDYECAMTVW